MRKFNLIKSLTRVNNIITLPFRKGLGLGLKSIKMGLLCLSLTIWGVNDAWGDSYYYAKLSVKSSTGHGKVYVEELSTTNSTPVTKTKKSEANTKSVNFTIKADVVPGYSFKWGDNNTENPRSITISTSKEKEAEAPDGGTYDGQYTAKNDTKYTVKHYQQNVDGSYPANATETDNLTGTTDTKVTPNRKSYSGFTAPAGKELTIKGDGSASVSYNYTRNSYTLTWNLDGGTITTAGTPAGSVKYGATLTAPTVSKAGSQFNGWSPSVPSTMLAEDIAFTAQWVSKFDFEMSGEDRSMKVDEELPNAFAFTHAKNPEAHISNTNIITYDAANNKLVAHQEGTATIYFTQAETTNIYAGTSDTYTITVSKIANTLAADATKSMKVDETWSGVISGKNSDGEIKMKESTDPTIVYFDVANNKIIAQNTNNQSFNSKEVTITISQEATYKYTAAEKTITVTVSKWDNHISINGSQDNYQASIYVDAEHSIALTATNTDYLGSPISATPDNDVTTINAAKTQVSSNSKLGTTVWTLSQPENYKYKAANATMTINVVKQAEATDCYVLNDINEHSNKTTVTSTKGVYGDPLIINGPADKLTFDIKYEGSVFPALKLFVEYSIDGGNSYNNVYPDAIEERPSDYKSFGPYTLDSRTTHIRFFSAVGTTNTVKYTNVRVTRKTYLNASDLTIEKTTANEVIYPNEQGEGTITINRSLTNDGGNLKVAWDSDKFTINGKTAAEGLDLGNFDCATGTSTLDVVFSSDVAGTFSTPVRIYNKVYHTTVTLIGITHERETSPFVNKETTTDVSLNDQDKVTLDVAQFTNDYVGNGEIMYELITMDNANLSGRTFYATKVGTYQVKATASQTNKYNKAEKIITINVVKRIPTFSWKQYDHIYAGEILEDVASTFYNGNSVDLQLTYTNVSGSFAVEGNKLHISKQFTEEHDAIVGVTTTETDYYAQASEEHTYRLESKKLPKFYLNGVEMSTEAENNLTLKIGETANVSFDQTEESQFTYTNNAQFVTYAHDATQHTGVFTATASGDEGFQFHQAGTTTVFDRTCQMHIWVKKHTNTLSSPIQDNDVWMVDSIYAGDMYSIIDDGYTGHAQESVIVESDNEAVIRHMQDGSWKAVGEGTATITMRQLNNAYWTGDTIARVIKVQKHTPVITWNIENAQYPWSSVITEPVTSSNTDVPFTVTSNNKSVADYVDGRIVVYNTTGSVTFTLAQEGNYKWNAATTNLTKSFSTFQPANHVPFTLTDGNRGNFEQSKTSNVSWKSLGYELGNDGRFPTVHKTFSVTIRFTGVPDKLSFTKTLGKALGLLPENGDCNCYVYESADGSSWSQCWSDVERVETRNVSNLQLQPTTRYLKFEYKESCLYCTYSNINVTERSSVEPVANSLDFGTGYNGNTAAKRSVDVNWYSVMPCTVAISGADASQFYVGDDSKTIASSLDNSGIVTLNVFYTHEENKSHTATLTITSGDTPAKTATIQLAGTTERAPQEIIWRDDITPLPHNGGVYEGAALASSGGDVVLASDDESIVKVVGTGLQPVGVGTTTIHAYQAGDDIKWQPVNAEKTIEVTSLSVQHLIWNDQLNNIKRTDGQTVNITLTAQSDAIALDPSLVVTYELDDDAKAFASVTDNQLTITGWGSGYITAKQVGNANYVPAQQTKRLVSRNPDVDCRALAAEDANEYTLHTIASQEINITNGEPATIEFDAKMDLTAIGEGLHLDEWYNDSWHEATYIDWDVMAKNLGSYAHYGPYNLNRKTTKVRFYTNTGATMRRYFKNVEVTLARYLEVAQNDMSFAGVDKGAFLDQTFYINYSNLRGTLDVELQNTSSNLQVITTTVGNDCGEIGQMVPVKIRCTGNVCGTENNVIVLSNKGQKLEVPVSATVVPPSQNITWNPQTTILTTDVVALNATCTSNLPISYSSNNTDVAAVQQDGSGVWSMTIIKDGTVTITASQAGSADWSPAPDKNVVFNISKATPVVTTWATPSEVTKWSALSTSTLTGGEASVAGSFSWQDGTIQVERGNSGYTMVFTPTNTNWYNTVTNTIVVPVAKDPQTITWNYTPQPMYCNAELYFDAVASSGLKVRYESSDPTIAYVNDNRLVIIKGGNVTITAVQDGDDTWAYTSLSKNLEILRWTPNIVTKPVANSMLIGQHLDNATLNGGRAELGDKQVDGSFSWQNGSVETIDVAGKATRVVVFTPSNPNHYNSATCEVEVDVKKYAPTVTHTLSATDITYGQALNASSLNGILTAMDEVKYPHEEVAGTYNWKETTKQLSAGKHTEIVRFTPSNLDWYDVVDIEISVVVNKAHATTATAVVNMLYGQTLEEVLPINTTADMVSGVVEGIITWDASVDVEAIPAQGEYDYPIHLAITDPNYVAETIDGTCHVVVEKGFVFDGHGGSSDWNTEGNWVDGSQPTGMEDKVIVIADATIINSEINVGAITIKQGVDVIIEEDGVLNVGDYDCVSRKQYGNMVVKNGGQLNLNTGEVQVNDFTLEASLGGQKDAERVSARSGSITNAEQLKVNGNAYFDIALDANGECTQGWYDLTVPFPVNALTGVQRFENGVLRTNLKNEVNYAIMSYHEDVRAQGKYGWSKFRGIMQPGQCYTITIDDYHNVYRFVKTASGALNASNTLQVTATVGEGGDENKGWNCVGNGTCHHANIAIEGVDKVQIYDHATNSYSPINFADKTFAVGSAFFVQTPQSESILYSQHVSDGVLYAPRRAPHATQEFLVTLSSIKDQSVADKLYLSASDDATNTYEIGHDLSKFGVSSTIAQMWCTAYNMQLCDVELPWVGETAIFPIEIFAPKTGEYILSVPQTHKDEQLFLLYDGIVMTELTASEFILPLNKGVNKNYALQIVTNRSIATTNEDNEMLQNASTRKAIVNDKLYIFYGDKIFDANGKRIK